MGLVKGAIYETFTGNGTTGTITLDGPKQGYLAFSAYGAQVDGQRMSIYQRDPTTGQVQYGTAIYSLTANTLGQFQITFSSTGSAIAWPNGTSGLEVLCDYLPEEVPNPATSITFTADQYLYREGAGTTALDLRRWLFRGQNGGGTVTDFAELVPRRLNGTAGSEAGALDIYVRQGGARSRAAAFEGNGVDLYKQLNAAGQRVSLTPDRNSYFDGATNGQVGHFVGGTRSFTGFPRGITVGSALDAGVKLDAWQEETTLPALRGVGNPGLYASDILRLSATRAGTSVAYNYLACYSDNSTTMRLRIRSDGNIYTTGSLSLQSLADPAEAFEWSDGNPGGEDRVALPVVLEGEKIREATAEDDPNEIIGVTSGNPAIVMDAEPLEWRGKWLRDDYGRPVEVDGKRRLNPEYDHRASEWLLDRVTGEPVAKPGADGVMVPEPNPEYDPARGYVGRLERETREWHAVGFAGKVPVRRGRPVHPRWRKLRKLSEAADLWWLQR